MLDKGRAEDVLILILIPILILILITFTLDGSSCWVLESSREPFLIPKSTPAPCCDNRTRKAAP